MWKHYVTITGLKTDSAEEKPDQEKFSRVSLTSGDSFTLRIFKQLASLSFIVKGSTPGLTPYLTGLTINGESYCDDPDVSYLDKYAAEIGNEPGEHQWIAESQKSNIDCGRPKVTHAEPLENGPAKPGDWPWHAAIYYRTRADRQVLRYTGGGTLISRNSVMTAAHQVMAKGKLHAPGVFRVTLGKYNLNGKEEQSQESNVQKIIIHEDFDYSTFSSNIALMKLESEVTFTDYVQPACLWPGGAADRLSDKTIIGIIAGWGYNNDNTLPDTLQQALLPMVSALTCIRSYPNFYSYYLGANGFCAGYHNNGTSACNGDSGGGFHVFIPDDKQDESGKVSGAWYVRGIVSHSLALRNKVVCDPDQYTVFTDVAKFVDWIEEHLYD